MMVTIGPRTPALTLLPNQFQVQAVVLIPLSSTIPSPTAMVLPVHHTKIIECLVVLCAQGNKVKYQLEQYLLSYI